MSKAAEYRIWAGIKSRVANPNANGYSDYAGRGIKLCPEWFNNFPLFYEHVGPRPTAKHTIERINNYGNYEPGNVRWATRIEQNSNTRANRYLTANGITDTLCGWARRIGICHTTLAGRLERWTMEKALTTPKLSHRHA